MRRNMKSASKYQKIIFGLIAFGMFFFTACEDDSIEKDQEKADKEEVAILVSTEAVSYSSFTDYIEAIGTAEAIEISNLSVPTGGRVEKVRKTRGSYVKEGDVIIELENDQLKAQLDANEAQYKLAQVNFERQEKIYKDSVTSEMTYLQALYQRDQALAMYELSKSQYDNTFLKAPFSGYVDETYYEVGEVAGPGLPIATLLNPSIIKIEANIPEYYASEVELGDVVLVEFDEFPGETFTSKVSFVSKMLNPDNRAFLVEVKIRNEKSKIKPGMNARIKIQRDAYDRVVLIPATIPSKTDLGYVVFVANGPVAEMRVINIISRGSNNIVVDKGLEAGDQLIVEGYQALVDGEKIKIVNN